MNTIILVGNVGRDPDMSYLPDGTAVTKFSIADSAPKKKGETDSKTTWYNVIAWRGLAETCSQFLHKGSKVYIQGALDVREYVTKDGRKGIALDVVADKVQFLDARPATSDPTSNPTATPATATSTGGPPDDGEGFPF